MAYTLDEAYEAMSDWSKDANNVRTRLTQAECEELGVEGLLKMASDYADEVQRQLEEEGSYPLSYWTWWIVETFRGTKWGFNPNREDYVGIQEYYG